MTTDWAGRGFQGEKLKKENGQYARSDSQTGRIAPENLERRELSEIKESCRRFLKEIGYSDPTSDSVDQLAEVFVPCLGIMIRRGYDPNGATWREGGWRSQLVDIRKKFKRLWFHGWIHGQFMPDHGFDLINYTGYYQRIAMQGKPWGEWGEPDEGTV